MCVALGRSKKCMWYQLSLLRVIQFELGAYMEYNGKQEAFY